MKPPFASTRPTLVQRLRLALAAAILALPTLAAAQSAGAVAGTVTAAENAAPVAGAVVTVEGTSLGVPTDARGRFRIARLVPGGYTLTVAAMGREPSRRAVQVAAGETAAADFALAPGSVLLSGLVVTANRTPTLARRVTATVNVLAHEQVERSPARTVDDLVRELPGVELPRTSGSVAGNAQIVSIRGMDEGRTLVLLDRVPLNDPWGEWVDWQRAPVYGIDRVELTEGGGSSLYGNYAMGGVIQLVSRPMAPHTAQGTFSAGSRGLREASVFGSDVAGRLAFAVDGTLADGGGYVAVAPGQRGAIDVDNSSTRRNAGLRAEYALRSDRTVSARVSVLDEDRSGGTELTPMSRRIGAAALGASLGGVAGGRVDADLFGTLQREVSHQAVAGAGRATETPAMLQSIPARDLGGSVQWARDAVGPVQLSAGGDFRWMHGTLDEDVYDGAGALARTTASGGSQVVGGAFVQGVLTPAAPLRIEASLRGDVWHNYAGRRAVSDSAAATTFDARTDRSLSPRLGVRVQAARGFAVRGSVFRAFRAPSLSEQYRSFISGNTRFLPNPDLGPEHLSGADLGFDWQPAGPVELRVTGFANRMRGLTDFEFLKPGYLMRQNLGKAHSRGVEAEAAVTAAEWLRLSATYNYDDAKTEAGARVHRVPLNRYVARAQLGTARVGELTAIYRHEGPSLSLSAAPLKAYDVVDATLRRELPAGATLFAAVENLTGTDYLVDQTGPLSRVGLPRTFRLGLTWVRR
ncbi:MAG: TonB-dependent receptor [Gemmatimonadetes bacterium]|nr:TonB-dependent receptor [Gemmatimonadota bacterium]